MKRADKAVSETVGTLLLLGMSITLFSIIYFSIVTIYPISANPTVNLICFKDENTIIIEHRGGESLSLDTKILLNIGGIDNELTVGEIIENDSNSDGFWSIGERLVYNTTQYYDNDIDYTENCNLGINIIDKFSNSIVMTGIINDPPRCDIGVELTVDNLNPRRFTNVLFTLKVTNHGYIPAYGAIVEFLLPEGLTFVSCNMTQGLYNSSNGLWDVGRLSKNGGNATLWIIATVGDVGGGEPTQLAVLLDGSASISTAGWTLMLNGL